MLLSLAVGLTVDIEVIYPERSYFFRAQTMLNCSIRYESRNPTVSVKGCCRTSTFRWLQRCVADIMSKSGPAYPSPVSPDPFPSSLLRDKKIGFSEVRVRRVLGSSQQVWVDGIMLGGGKANPPVIVGGRRRTPFVG
jgi:hypothetical protein